MRRSPWWRGQRGEWYVVVQFCLFAVVAFGPRSWNGWPKWPLADGLAPAAVGWSLLVGCLVRHPMYCGAVLAAFGWAILSRGWLTVGYGILLFVLFDLKSRREEKWLVAKFADYGEYQGRVRKLIPFVY